ncbi:S-adenosyl-L-methionine-dependentmethyltransferases superfamily protein [Striga asiatica]|uniref:S-adenosyl-L-methionine-dependentmethyltransferases superfamily protein n=1 Tax=Striga asiatica TaxID=4170 RepID=A0A5A7QBH5_STRAF|nr:S-adenosyl-L-methionine-dependentmethyltransferases superfamily protein [Striga asiatica]
MARNSILKLLHESQAIQRWTLEGRSSSLHFQAEFERQSTEGNAIVTKNNSEDKESMGKKCAIPDDEPKPDDDYIVPQGCYINVAAPYSMHIANVLCSGEIDIDNLIASEECGMIWGMGEDCLLGESSEDVIKRYHCNEDLDLIKYRVIQVDHGCGIK